MLSTSLYNENLIQVEHLKKYFAVRSGLLGRAPAYVQTVDDVSFTVRRGECLGLVGESGCGKTTVGRTILRLILATSGQVLFEGRDVFAFKGAAFTRVVPSPERACVKSTCPSFGRSSRGIGQRVT